MNNKKATAYVMFHRKTLKHCRRFYVMGEVVQKHNVGKLMIEVGRCLDVMSNRVSFLSVVLFVINCEGRGHQR